MFEKIREKITHVSKETVKEEIKNHYPEIMQGATVLLLLYACIRINGKPVNVTVNVNGGGYFV